MALKLLEDSIVSHFPNTNPDTNTDSQFGVYLKDWGSDTYVINDLDLDILTKIPIELLNDPTFDLIGWYCNLLWESGVFYNKYALEQSSKLLEINEIPGSNMLNDNELSEQSIDIEDSHNKVVLLNRICEVLISCQPYPSDHNSLSLELTDGWFVLECEDDDIICIYDVANLFETCIFLKLAAWSEFSIAKWFAEHCIFNEGSSYPWEVADIWMKHCDWSATTIQKLMVHHLLRKCASMDYRWIETSIQPCSEMLPRSRTRNIYCQN